MRLSPHFTVEEFACHDGTAVPVATRGMLSHLCADYLEPLRARWGPVTVMSGYRTAGYNRKVHGAPASYHVYRTVRQGVAADVTCKRGRPEDWHKTLAALNPGGLGYYPDHVHVDNRAGHARW